MELGEKKVGGEGGEKRKVGVVEEKAMVEGEMSEEEGNLLA